MRRPLWLRLVVAAWTLWVGVMLVGPPALHACPVHGNHASHHMADMGTSMPDMAGMPSQADHHGTPAPQPESHCTCLGACCSAVPVSPPAAQIAEITVDEPVAVVPIPPVRDERATTAAPPHSLPFANAPPTLA